MKTQQRTVVILGSGIAGLYCAVNLAENYSYLDRILLVTKSTIRESNTRYAQGGIVGVMPDNKNDSVELHVSDTLKAGAGLSDINVAEFMSNNSSEVIKDLVRLGVEFDKDSNDSLSLTLEAAHSVRRILHAGGDATGKNIETALCNHVEHSDKIEIYQEVQAVELLVDSDETCRGVVLFDPQNNEYQTVYSSAVVIATGGIGQVYSNTTNPKIATGDGIALAYKANAMMQNMEFVQFHPTALNIEGIDSRFLISESVRGEGARLKNIKGEYFGEKYDPQGDLAPRDIVTRSIFFEMQKNCDPYVLLDTSFIDNEKLKNRFPNIAKSCADNGIDVFKEPIPVSPAAHYCMGGIKVTLEGKTSIKGLYAIGECSCNGLHGANRLASNSLLECVVASRELAKYIGDKKFNQAFGADEEIENIMNKYCQQDETNDQINHLVRKLKQTMWENAGIVRNQQKLNKALNTVSELKEIFNKEYKCSSLKEYEFRNMLLVSEIIIKSAISRKESRGSHYREDYPQTSKNSYNSTVRKGDMLSCQDTCTIF